MAFLDGIFGSGNNSFSSSGGGSFGSVLNNIVNGAKNIATNFANNFGKAYIPNYTPITNNNWGNAAVKKEEPKYYQPSALDLINQTANSAFNNIDFVPKTPNIQELTKNFKDGLNNISDVFDEDSLFDNVSKAVNNNKENKTNLENIWGNIDIPKMVGSSLLGPVIGPLAFPQQASANQETNNLIQDTAKNIGKTLLGPGGYIINSGSGQSRKENRERAPWHKALDEALGTKGVGGFFNDMFSYSPLVSTADIFAPEWAWNGSKEQGTKAALEYNGKENENSSMPSGERMSRLSPEELQEWSDLTGQGLLQSASAGSMFLPTAGAGIAPIENLFKGNKISPNLGSWKDATNQGSFYQSLNPNEFIPSVIKNETKMPKPIRAINESGNKIVSNLNSLKNNVNNKISGTLNKGKDKVSNIFNENGIYKTIFEPEKPVNFSEKIPSIKDLSKSFSKGEYNLQDLNPAYGSQDLKNAISAEIGNLGKPLEFNYLPWMLGIGGAESGILGAALIDSMNREKHEAQKGTYHSPISDEEKARIQANKQAMFNDLMNSDSNWYEHGLASNTNPLLAQGVLSANTRDYYGSMGGIGPRDLTRYNPNTGKWDYGRQLKDYNLWSMNPMSNIAAMFYNPNQEFNPNNYNSLMPSLHASELFGTYKDSQDNNKEKPILWNPTRTMPLRSQKQYEGIEEESPYVEDRNFYLLNTPGGKEYNDVLDRNGLSVLSDFGAFRYGADDPMWEYMIERGWEPYYEYERDENGNRAIGDLKRDKNGRIIREDMNKVMDWLNDIDNIFVFDEAAADPNARTWRNFGSSSSDILSHLNFLNSMQMLQDPLSQPDYLKMLGDNADILGKLDENDRALYAALDLLDKQGGKINKGQITEGVLNALFEKANEPYRIGKTGEKFDKEGNDLFLDYKNSGRNNPLKSNFEYFANDNQVLKPYYNPQTDEANFFENYLDSILWRNKDYGIQTADNIAKYNYANDIHDKATKDLSEKEEWAYQNSIAPSRLVGPLGIDLNS